MTPERRTRYSVQAMQRTIAIILTLLGAATLASCEQTQSGGGSDETELMGGAAESTTTSIISARWPFWPVRVRIHPLTMLSSDLDTGEPIVEARVEMLDQFGDTMKGVAQFRFELHRLDPGEGPGDPVRVWNVDLRNVEANARHWDRVTRTYLFRLALESPLEPDADWHLRAYVLSIDGRQFTTTRSLR